MSLAMLLRAPLTASRQFARRFSLTCSSSIVAFGAVPTVAFAQVPPPPPPPPIAPIYKWIGPNEGSWFDPANWSTNKIPINTGPLGPGGDTEINAPGTTVVIDQPGATSFKTFTLWFGSLRVTETGSYASDHRIAIGNQSTSVVGVNLAGSFTTTDYFGMGGRATLDIASTGALSVRRFFMGTYMGEVASTADIHGTLTSQQEINLSGAGTNTLTAHAGSRLTATYIELNADVPASSGTLNLGNGAGAGTVDVAYIDSTGTSGLLNLNHDESAYTLAPQLTGTLKVAHLGPGTSIFTGDNSYTGGTTLENGTLRAGIATAFGSGDVIVNGGILDLNGFTVVNRIDLRVGTLQLSGHTGVASLTWQNDAIIAFTLGADDSTSDLLTILGAFTKSGENPFVFNFDTTDAITGQTYTLASFDSTTFSVNDFSFTNTGPFDGMFSLTGNTLTFTIAAVPEPSTCALLAGCAVLMLALRRKKRRH